MGVVDAPSLASPPMYYPPSSAFGWRLGLLALAACTADPAPVTDLRVFVYADDVMASRLSALDVWVLPVGAESLEDKNASHAQISLRRGAGTNDGVSRAFPVPFEVRKGGANRFILVVEGRVPEQDQPVVRQSVIPSFQDGQRGIVKLLLSDVCYQTVCEGLARTCRNSDAECEDAPELPFTPLPGVLPNDPPAITPMASQCSDDTRDCGATGTRPRLCVSGHWEVEEACADDATCVDGRCVAVGPCASASCADGGPSDAEVDAGPDSGPAVDSGDSSVTCAPGACRHGLCEAGATDYTCRCDPGFEHPAGDTKTCVNTDECAQSNLCSGTRGSAQLPFAFQCVDRTPEAGMVPAYSCIGQQADWDPAAIATSGRFQLRRYLAGGGYEAGAPNDPNTVVHDSVTRRDWQHVLTDPVNLTIDQARSHCAQLQVGIHDDYRIPSYVELVALVDDEGPSAFDATLFPGQGDGWLLADGATFRDFQYVGNTYVASEGFIISAFNGNGKLRADAVDDFRGNPAPQHVRCVRTGEGP